MLAETIIQMPNTPTLLRQFTLLQCSGLTPRDKCSSMLLSPAPTQYQPRPIRIDAWESTMKSKRS